MNRNPGQGKRFDASAAKEQLSTAVEALNALAAVLTEPEEEKTDDTAEDSNEPAAIPESPTGEGDGEPASRTTRPGKTPWKKNAPALWKSRPCAARTTCPPKWRKR